MIIEEFKYESPLKRLEDFKIIKKFIEEKTCLDNSFLSCLELGAGEGWFTIIALSHGWICEAIDNSETLDSIKKHKYVKKEDFNDLNLKKKFNIIHSNMFQYISKEELEKFFEKNSNCFDLLFISYNTKISNKKETNDKNRISFFTDETFSTIAQKYNLEYITIKNTKSKKFFCRKGVLRNGA